MRSESIIEFPRACLPGIVARVVGAAVFMLACSGAAEPRYLHEGSILIRNASIIDGLGHRPVRQRDILIDDGRIAQIAATGRIAALPAGTHVIDAKHMTVLPGLMDLHVHFMNYSFDLDEYGEPWIDSNTQKTLNAYLYAGVTTVLNLGDNTENVVRVRDQVAAGERMGPRIVAVGSTVQRLHSVKSASNMPSDEVQEEISSLLDERQQAGIELVKIYTGVTPWGARHLVKQAHERDMRVIADFWCTNLSRTVFETTGLDAYAHGACRELTQEEAEWIADNDKFVIMTLAAFDILGGHLANSDYEGDRSYFRNDLIAGPWGKQMTDDYYDTFSGLREYFYDGEDSFYQRHLFGDMTNLLPDGQRTVKKLFDVGALIALGTDANFPPGTFPGDSMHHELLLHVEAGIDPVDVIKLATSNAARILKLEDIGSIERGKVADLLIVQGDPSTNISDTRNVANVIKGGNLIDRNSLRAH